MKQYDSCKESIQLGGLPASGKSTIANRLAQKISAVYLRIDTIEQAIRNAGKDVVTEGYLVTYGIAEDNLKIDQIVIVDSVNPLNLTREAYRAIAINLNKPPNNFESLLVSSIEFLSDRI